MTKSFSPYMLKIFDDCPKLFDFMYNQKIYLPQAENFTEIGENIHILINYYLKNNDISKMLSILSKEENILWENFLKNPILKQEFFTSEYNFILKFDEHFLTGRCDAIFKNQEKFYIVDWKTGIQKNEVIDYQSEIYLYALSKIFIKKNLIKNQSKLIFKYIYLKENTEINIEYNIEKFLNFEKFLTQKIKEILEKQPVFLNSKKCYTCNYFPICYNSSN